jgi:5-hydroxyisourate hydrolase
VLDVEHGRPAAGVPVALSRREGDTLVAVASAETGPDGRIQRLGGEALPSGVYQLAFDTGAYLRRHGHEAPFLQRVLVEFYVADSGGHYHVPLLLSPYSCTSYRGS